MMQAGALDTYITIEQRSETQEGVYGTDIVSWTTLASVWAQINDVLPSRAESVDNGVSMARRPARIRIRYRSDVTSDMRIDIDGRKLRIVGGPAELGRRQWLELVAEELSTEGTAP